MADTGPADPGVHRLHPFTLIVNIPASLKPLALPLFAVYAFSSSESSARNLLIFALIGAGLSLVANVFRFVSLRYGVVGDQLVIRSGILFKRSRSIPLERVQNIDLKAGPFHRVLGVAEVRVETAGSAEGSEAHLSVVGRADAELFRNELLARAGRRTSPGTAEVPDEVIYKAGLADLFVAGATANRVGVIVASLFGIYEFMGGDPTEENIKGLVATVSEKLPTVGTASQIVAAILVVFLLIVAGWLVSITLAVVRHYGFVLTRRATELRSRYGLLTRVEAVIPLHRVQLLRLEANPVRRLIGTTTVAAQTAAAADTKDSSGEALLSPLIADGDAPDLCRSVIPELDLAAIELQPVHRLAIRRGFIRFSLMGAVIVLVLWLTFDTKGLIAIPFVLAGAWALSRLRYRALRYARFGSFLVARAGIWTRRLWIVPESKVQSVTVRRSPFQRRLGLASLHIDTAGSSALSNPRVIDLAVEDAEALREELAIASNASGLLRGGI